MTTKAQEREILAKIEKLIASAGPDSYIAAAFTGCVELAADNIENDFCTNFPDRLHRLEHDTGVLSKSVDNMTAEIRNLKEEREALRAELESAQAKQIPAGIYKRLWLAVEAHETAAAESMRIMSNTLADLADAPSDIAVKHGLKVLANAKKKQLEAAELLKDLEKYEPADA